MILHKHINTRLGEIWIIDATENGFYKAESESKQEFETRVLSQMIEFTLGNVTMSHTSTGAPFIEDHPELSVSISHSEHWFAIYLSNNHPVGIDLETPSNHIDRIQHHFLSNVERNHLDLSTDNLRVFWGAKESIVKYNKGNVKDFQRDIQIESISGNKVTARFDSKLFQLKYSVHRQFVLVYTI